MALRTDVTVDWSLSPRVITVASPSLTITIQDLDDTLRNLESKIHTGMQFGKLCDASGKNDLGGGTQTGITLTLQNAQLAFAARGGPTFVQCTITGGTLVAVDANQAFITAISTTAFTQVVIQLATSAALISSGNFNVSQINSDASAAVNLSKSAAGMPYATVDNAGFAPTTTQFETSSITTGYADHYKKRLVLWRTGTLANNVTDITAYSVVANRGHFTVSPMPAAPGNGDGFVVV